MDSIAQHAALLTVLLPIIGAAAVRGFRGTDDSARRMFAITNTLCTLGVVLLAMAFYQVSAVRRGGESRTPMVQLGDRWVWLNQAWPGAPEPQSGIWFSAGYDGLSLWSALQIAVLFVIVALMTPRQTSQPASRTMAWWTAFLLWEAALLMTVLAQDVVLLVCGLIGGVLPIAWLVGHWGRMGRRSATARWVAGQLMAVSLIALGLGLVVAAYPWLKADLVVSRPAPTTLLPQLLSAIPQLTNQNALALNYWIDVAPWAGWSLATGLLMRLGCWPFHSRWREFLLETPDDLLILLIGLWLPLNLHATLRLLCVLLPDYFVILQPLFAAGVLWGGLLSLTQTRWREWQATVYLTGISFCLCGATTATLSALLGSWQLAHLWSLCAAGLWWSAPSATETGAISNDGTSQPTDRAHRGNAVAFTLFGLGFTWFVGLGASWGAQLTWTELWSSGGNALWCVALGWLCVCISAIDWILPLNFLGRDSARGLFALDARANAPQEAKRPNASSRMGWLLLMALCLLWLGGGMLISRSSKSTLLRWLPVLMESDAPDVDSGSPDSGKQEPG